MPILTPRFIPSCSNALLNELSEVRRTYDLPVQSHLSENPEEVELVKRLMPEAEFYGDGYDRFGLFGSQARTVMAHCVYSTDEEVERIRKNGVWVAHCPNSNMNIASGIAPIRRYLEAGIRVGLGSDVAGGQTESMFRAITDAIQVSKLLWRYLDPSAIPLSFANKLYIRSNNLPSNKANGPRIPPCAVKNIKILFLLYTVSIFNFFVFSAVAYFIRYGIISTP